MKLNPYKSKARYAAVSGMLLALALAFTALESQLSAFLPVGVRLGLANVVIMAALQGINKPTAFVLTVLKSAFVLVSRGITAGMMSLCGGILAFAVMCVLFRKTSLSYIFISVCCAVSHTAGQLSFAVFLTGSGYTFFYAPLLAAASIASGVCTGLVLGTVMPHAKKLFEADRKF